MSITPTIEERVAAGEKWLDNQMPWWDEVIDLRELDLTHACKCVLGQLVKEEADLYNGYYYAVQDDSLIRLDEHYSGKLVLSTEEAREMGFHLGTNKLDEEWYHLTDAWRDLIIRRREAREQL